MYEKVAPVMITCRELIEFLDEYVAGEMTPTRRQSVDKHLAVCPDCVNYVESYRKTIALGRAAFDDVNAPAPTDVPAALVRRPRITPRLNGIQPAR